MQDFTLKQNHPDGLILNIAAFVQKTRVLGPGNRAGIWVQGCQLNCPGCIAPDWQEFRPNRLISVDDLTARIMKSPKIDGLTISGGEPMLQANALSRLIRKVRERIEINVVCYTGFTIKELEILHDDDIDLFLSEIDVLIDGRYLQEFDNNKGLRGSSNQNVHFLSSRLKGKEFICQTRNAEVHFLEGEALLVGVPDHHLLQAFDQAKKRMQARCTLIR